MENNNAIAAKPEMEGEAKIENVKPTAEEDSSPNPRNSGYRYNNRRRQQYRREVNPEDETGKAAIRRKIWDNLEDSNLVSAPRPCHYRIPNFEGAAAAADHLTTLEEFKKASTIKVNPDKAQEHARFLVLEEEKELVLLNQNHKELMVPVPELKSGLLNRVTPPKGANKEEIRHCCTTQGVKESSQEIALGEPVKLDLIIVGSVAVSRNGFRIGKGKGYADLEYSMMRTMGAADANTVIVTSVHDSQVVDIPEELVEEHDITVDYIMTPTELIKTNCNRPRPTGVIWNHLEVNKFYQIPVLRQLRKTEKDDGKEVLLKDQKEEDEDPVDAMEPPRPRRYVRYYQNAGGYQGDRGGRGGGRGSGRPYSGRYRRGGGRRRMDDGGDDNKENVDGGEDSGADGDNEGRGNRRGGPPRRSNYRNRRFRRGGGSERGGKRFSESEHSDGGGADGIQEDGDDRPRRYNPNRRRFNDDRMDRNNRNDRDRNDRQHPDRRRRFGGNRRDNRNSADVSGSDGDQKNSADEDGEGRRPQRQRFRTNPEAVVFVGALTRNLRVSELKTELRSHNVNPVRLLWRGGRGYAFLFFTGTDNAKEAVDVLTGRSLNGKEMKVEMANMDRDSRRRPNRNDRGRDEQDLDGHDHHEGNEE